LLVPNDQDKYLYLSDAYFPMKNHIYHLITGSNLGERVRQLSRAEELIGEDIGIIKRKSGIYETQPWGYEDQPWFLNEVLEVSSPKTPQEVLKIIRNIELKAGRLLNEKWHARHIDIDLLFCGDLVIENLELTIPHPLLHTRNFVLVPLMDLIPEFMHPKLEKTIEELYLDCRDNGEVYIFNADEQE
jgi:2-amino-4-hydroxy-6-hydroxymethyldihydropteridine diphosphokinase